MKKEKDKWEEFKDLPETYETNDNLVPKVKYEIFREKHTKRRVHWQAIVASITICAVGVGIFVPVYLSNYTNEKEEQKYYIESNLENHSIEDIEDFVEKNNFEIVYYTGENIISKSITIKETNELALISQDMIVVEENFADNVQLKIQLMTDCKFDMLQLYDSVNQNIYISDIHIQYLINEENGMKQILAKFTYESIPYYLEIQTDDATGKLEKYVNMLFEEQEETYLDDGVIINSVVEDPQGFIDSNNLDILYYSDDMIGPMGMGNTMSGKLEDTGELTFFSQRLMFITEEMTVDELSLQILLLPDKKFSKLKMYENLPDSIMISGIQVEYGYTDKGQRKVALVKFIYNGLPYFLDIQADDLEGKVEYYVGLLLSGAKNSLVA